ncbi:MAG: alpha/beta hydrolase [Planctomycetota bacterium]
MDWRRRAVIWLGIALAVYLLLVGVVAWNQDRLVFPMAGAGDRGSGNLPGVTTSTLRRPDGGEFRIATARPIDGTAPFAVAVYFVGNGEDLLSAAYGALELSRYGLEVVGVEHPGYGASAGPPNVETFQQGAEVAAAHARARAAALGVPLIAVGSSLGTFCAVHLAAQGLVDRLLLRAPPTSMAAAAKARFWWLPVDLLLRHRFDSLAVAGRVRCPALVVHGDRDGVVPLALGRELAAAFAGPTELIVVPGDGHNDLRLDREGPSGARIGAFLRGR